MKTLITGDSGFIGSNPVQQFWGHEVTILDNLLSGYRSNLGRGSRKSASSRVPFVMKLYLRMELRMRRWLQSLYFT